MTPTYAAVASDESEAGYGRSKVNDQMKSPGDVKKLQGSFHGNFKILQESSVKLCQDNSRNRGPFVLSTRALRKKVQVQRASFVFPLVLCFF